MTQAQHARYKGENAHSKMTTTVLTHKAGKTWGELPANRMNYYW
jgi:hypothetical protein